MKVILEISLLPLAGTPHFSQPIARFLEVLGEHGICYELSPMGTVIEGEWDEIMRAIKTGLEHLHSCYPRIYGIIKFDIGSMSSAREKVEKVQKLLLSPKE